MLLPAGKRKGFRRHYLAPRQPGPNRFFQRQLRLWLTSQVAADEAEQGSERAGGEDDLNCAGFPQN
jgi:hypothetical protein